ncbi:hypothetical protein KXJ69_00165 [Aureisphaera sp. CAU 1614]|uniref:Uncharacterized protein n=1 Tax=Halomarinibacterium sedimenti TaxID=2857106 RepID=A0A9X1JYR4_9FLAO|nr:hypothetical protein [Halomarinibacterium sedimenti]MBW2936496.1 hypothetical protein [Halomarinibacterium sedimenti]
MIDFFKTFFETSKERIKNPLIGTFIISWMAINWRPIVVLLFSDQSIENRIDYIVSCYSSFKSYFLIPFLISLVYVIILPYFMWAVDYLIKKSTVERKRNVLNQVLLDYEGKQKIAIEESKLEDLKANFRDKADLNNQIELLRNQLDERDEAIKILNSEVEQQKSENQNLMNIVDENKKNSTETKSLILDEQFKAFENTDMYDYFREVGVKIRNERNFPNGINDIIKEKYIFQGIVEEAYDADNMFYQFTEKGRYFWRKYVNNIRVEKNIKKSNGDDYDDLPF